jgi:hypothetical protein
MREGLRCGCIGNGRRLPADRLRSATEVELRCAWDYAEVGPVEEELVEAWQIIVLAFLVLLPIALLIDYWPDRERLTARGAPLPRDWRPAPPKVLADDEHH